MYLLTRCLRFRYSLWARKREASIHAHCLYTIPSTTPHSAEASPCAAACIARRLVSSCDQDSPHTFGRYDQSHKGMMVHLLASCERQFLCDMFAQIRTRGDRAEDTHPHCRRSCIYDLRILHNRRSLRPHRTIPPWLASAILLCCVSLAAFLAVIPNPRSQ